MAKIFAYPCICGVFLSGCQLYNASPMLSIAQLAVDSLAHSIDQSLDKKDGYIIRKNRYNEIVDTSAEGMKSKKELVGNYKVVKQWSSRLRWSIDSVKFHLNPSSSLVMDFYGTGKDHPFLGVQLQKCVSKINPSGYGEQFKKRNIDKLDEYDGSVFIARMHPENKNLVTDIKYCGKDSNYDQARKATNSWIDYGVGYTTIEMKEVKKGYLLARDSSQFFRIDSNDPYFIIPEDGYILTYLYNGYDYYVQGRSGKWGYPARDYPTRNIMMFLVRQ